jgi:hypothetical protein
MRSGRVFAAGVVGAGVLIGAGGGAASAALVEYQVNARVSSTSGAGFYGFVPPVLTPVTINFKLDTSLVYVGSPPGQVNQYMNVPGGFTVQIGADSFAASSYGVFVQNQNFGTTLFVVDASGGFLWNGNPVPAMGGPDMRIGAYDPSTPALTPGMLDPVNPWTTAQYFGSLSQSSALPAPGQIDFQVLSVQLVPAPGAALGVGVVALGARRRRR